MEKHAGELLPTAYDDTGSPQVVRLHHQFGGEEKASSAQYSVTLAWLLKLEGRGEDALKVLEASLGLSPEDYDDRYS